MLATSFIRNLWNAPKTNSEQLRPDDMVHNPVEITHHCWGTWSPQKVQTSHKSKICLGGSADPTQSHRHNPHYYGLLPVYTETRWQNEYMASWSLCHTQTKIIHIILSYQCLHWFTNISTQLIYTWAFLWHQGTMASPTIIFTSYYFWHACVYTHTHWNHWSLYISKLI